MLPQNYASNCTTKHPRTLLGGENSQGQATDLALRLPGSVLGQLRDVHAPCRLNLWSRLQHDQGTVLKDGTLNVLRLALEVGFD